MQDTFYTKLPSLPTKKVKSAKVLGETLKFHSAKRSFNVNLKI